MKKKYIYTLIICVTVYFISEANLKYSTRLPFNYTGAEGSTCAQCHGNLNTGGGSVVTLRLPDSTFAEGQAYDFVVHVSHPSLRGRWGFSITARDANNQPVGSFSSTNPNAGPNETDLSHFMAVFKDSTSFIYDRLKWTAPVNPTTAQKTVKFYYVGNAANGDRGLTGDFIYSGTKSIVLEAPNQPPTVTINSPLDNSSFPAGAPITLDATASDVDGTITKVEFYDNNVKFLTDSTAPYMYTSTDAPPGNYNITARAFDNDGDSAVSSLVRMTVVACTPAGVITGEGYTNIPGNQVTDLINHSSYPDNPSITAQLNRFEYSNAGDNYGARIRGYICAPQTGNYTFYIAGDDQAGLWLSTDDNPANKTLIAYNLTPVGFRAWTTKATQKSAPIRLVKGVRYYIEALHKQSSGANHLSVAWVMPNGVTEAPIPGNRLSPIVSAITQARKPNFEDAMKVKTEAEIVSGLSITASPNPASDYFTVNIKSNTTEPIVLTVTDITGRIIETKTGAKANSSIQFGSEYRPGIYFIEVNQGTRKGKGKLKLLKM